MKLINTCYYCGNDISPNGFAHGSCLAIELINKNKDMLDKGKLIWTLYLGKE